MIVTGPVTVRLVSLQSELDACLRLRWTVFVEEQQVPPSEERDGHDHLPRADDPLSPIHALAEVLSPRGQPVPAGTGRVTWQADGVAKIQRMAVVDDARKLGVGRALLRFLEQEARARGAQPFTLGAQVHARGFYEREGGGRRLRRRRHSPRADGEAGAVISGSHRFESGAADPVTPHGACASGCASSTSGSRPARWVSAASACLSRGACSASPAGPRAQRPTTDLLTCCNRSRRRPEPRLRPR